MCKNKLLKEKPIQRELFVIEKPTLLTKRRQMKNPRQQSKVFGRQKWQQFKIRELLIEPYTYTSSNTKKIQTGFKSFIVESYQILALSFFCNG